MRGRAPFPPLTRALAAAFQSHGRLRFLISGCPPQMSELQASGVAAQRAIREYHNKVKQGILRPVQLAKGMIAAYPRVLNTLALGAVLGVPFCAF